MPYEFNVGELVKIVAGDKSGQVVEIVAVISSKSGRKWAVLFSDESMAGYNASDLKRMDFVPITKSEGQE